MGVVESTPLRWPAAWKDPGMLSLLQATSIRQILIDPGTEVPGLADEARRAGFAVITPPTLPAGVSIVKGLWPGIRVSHAGGDRAAAGPTGEPWVDSNGWRIRAARAIRPGGPFWVDAKPQPSRSSANDYVLAFADAAAHDGRLIITLDDRLAADLAGKKADAMTVWKRIVDAAAFFGADRPGGAMNDQAVLGVLATYAGPKMGFTDEVLNNLARTKQQYRPIASSRLTAASLADLKGVIYTDAAEPDSNTRKCVMDFVAGGGLLITGPIWGSLPKGGSPGDRVHPRFTFRTVGKGCVAVGSAFTEPYMASNDAVVVMSHRYDVVRFFNSGSITPCLAATADGRRAELRVVFYSLRPVEDTSVWIRGSYRTGRLRMWNQQEVQSVKLVPRDAGVEIYLPAVSQYAAIDLES